MRSEGTAMSLKINYLTLPKWYVLVDVGSRTSPASVISPGMSSTRLDANFNLCLHFALLPPILPRNTFIPSFPAFVGVQRASIVFFLQAPAAVIQPRFCVVKLSRLKNHPICVFFGT